VIGKLLTCAKRGVYARRWLLSTAMCFVALAVLLPPVLYALGTSNSLVSDLQPHVPIHIEGNDGFTPENGVRGGTGTSDDPYVIGEWSILSERVSGNSVEGGVIILNTNRFFIIRNCLIYRDRLAGRSDYVFGIGLFNVENGKIEGCTIINFTQGVRGERVSGLTVQRNEIHSMSGYGLVLSDAFLNLIEYNNITVGGRAYSYYADGPFGYDDIYIGNSQCNQILRNTIGRIRISGWVPLEGVMCNNSAFNTVAWNSVDVIDLYGTVVNNYIYSNSRSFIVEAFYISSSSKAVYVDTTHLDEGLSDRNYYVEPLKVNLPPKATFSVYPEVPDWLDPTVSLNCNCSDEDGYVAKVTWAIRDKENTWHFVTTVRNPAVRLPKKTSYIVDLFVTDNENATVRVSKTITVGDPSIVGIPYYFAILAVLVALAVLLAVRARARPQHRASSPKTRQT